MLADCSPRDTSPLEGDLVRPNVRGNAGPGGLPLGLALTEGLGRTRQGLDELKHRQTGSP